MSRYDMGRDRPDDFQSVPWMLDVLIPHLNPRWIIWDCAGGKGNLVNGLTERGFDAYGTDISHPALGYGVNWPADQRHDFLAMEPLACGMILTNPPYTLKDQFLKRCYEIGRPFALLMPLTALEGQVRQRLYARYGLELVFLPRRPEFQTPSGKNSGSWFACAWYCGFMGIGQQLNFNPPGIHTPPVADNNGKGAGFHVTRIAAREREQQELAIL